MADRADWEKATRWQRQLAVAADAELRRRHPGQPWPPLRSAEPEPASQAQDDVAVPNPGRNAILQPPKPQIPSSERILEHIADRDLDVEAAD